MEPRFANYSPNSWQHDQLHVEILLIRWILDNRLGIKQTNALAEVVCDFQI